MSQELDLGLAILDHQLLDRDGRRCGIVDDLAIIMVVSLTAIPLMILTNGGTG